MRGFHVLARAVVACSLAALTTLTGCHLGLLGIVMSAEDQGPYLPETLARELGEGHVRTVGCLDVGFVMHDRRERELLDLHVGNRCTHPEALDVRRLTIRGVGEEGASRAIVISDPRGEIERYHVGGSERGKERLRLEGARALSRVCFHLEGLAPDVPSARPLPLCLDRVGGAWKPASAPVLIGGAT